MKCNGPFYLHIIFSLIYYNSAVVTYSSDGILSSHIFNIYKLEIK